ncbi:TRAP transporter large permease subunit [Escherichia coli]
MPKVSLRVDEFYVVGNPIFYLVWQHYEPWRNSATINQLCRILGGRLPGSLAHCNILANMLFGAISGSAVASAAAMGGVVHPQQVKEFLTRHSVLRLTLPLPRRVCLLHQVIR